MTNMIKFYLFILFWEINHLALVIFVSFRKCLAAQVKIGNLILVYEFSDLWPSTSESKAAWLHPRK